MEISKAKIKLFASLAHKKHRLETGLFVVEGKKCVFDTLNFFELEWLVATKACLADADIESKYADKILVADRKQMSALSSLSTPSDIAAIYKLPNWSVDESRLSADLTLLLDGIQDPGNLGTIIRTADWFGIHQIVASNDTVDVFNPKTIQSTMGAISRVKVCYTDLCDFLSMHNSVNVYGTLLTGKNIYNSNLNNSGFLIMGNEGKGISEVVRKYINSPLLIPSYPKNEETSESLNVAIATAITLSEFRRRQI